MLSFAKMPSLTRDQRLILIDGAVNSFMVGCGETYLPAFALALGMSQVHAGLIATIPLLIGAILQQISPWAVQRLASHRKWVVSTVAVQAGSFLPLAVAAALGHAPDFFIFAVAAIYWGAGLAAGPAWTTWVATLVPNEMRARYFARRNAFAQAALLAGLIAGGGLLRLGAWLHAGSAIFVALFLLAAACRFASARVLFLQSEPDPLPAGHRHVGPRDIFSRLRAGRHGPARALRVILFMLMMQVAVYAAHPFFTPYVLEQLQVDYLSYVLLIGAPYLARIIALPALGRIAQERGSRTIVWVASAGFVALSLMWFAGGATVWLILAQLAGGIAWAAWELAVILVPLEAFRTSERTSLMTHYYSADAASKMTGSLLGGAFLKAHSASVSHYQQLFLLSTLARIAAIALLILPTKKASGVAPEASESIQDS